LTRLLLTNDDGIDAPGLAALVTAAGHFGTPIVAAPVEHQSGCSHRVTTNRPLRVTALDPDQHAIDGTPADCVRIGLTSLAPEATWVLSGINAGGNLGADVWHSGTVAAVREAVLHGLHGIAVSHYIKRELPLDWARAAHWTVAVLRELLQRPITPGGFWNVNLPHLEPHAQLPEIVCCPLDPSPLPIDFRSDGDLWQYAGNYHQRRRQAGGDVDVCFSGRIAVTEIRLF
jgi:5'-nucleotidase